MINRRYSQTRQIILSILKKSDKPLSAIEINIKLSKIKKVNKTTLYRELEILLNLKIINSVNLISEISHYEMADKSHHHHFVCIQCNQVEDLPCLIPNHDQIWLNEKHSLINQGLVILENPEITYKGICLNCNN